MTLEQQLADMAGASDDALMTVRVGDVRVMVAERSRADALADELKAKPALSVVYGPMPESNGKSNFTAILCRDGNILDGFTIARSEYPDRVRYDADCVRFLIGELAERPELLDYDGDKHSGYAAPAPASQDDAREAVLCNIADIVHYGGLRNVSVDEGVVAIRRLTLPWFNRNGTRLDAARRVDAALEAAIVAAKKEG